MSQRGRFVLILLGLAACVVCMGVLAVMISGSPAQAAGASGQAIGGAASSAGRAFTSEQFWSALGTGATLLGVLLAYLAYRRQREENLNQEFKTPEEMPENLKEPDVVRAGTTGTLVSPPGVESAPEVVKHALSEGDPEKQIALFRHATELQEGAYAPAWFYLAAALYNLKRYPDALAAAERANELSSGYPPYMNIMAKVLWDLGKRKQALKLAMDAAEGGGASGNVWYTYGLMLGDFHQDTAAVRALKKCVDLAPGNADYWQAYGDSWARLRNYDEALRAYTESLARKTDIRVMVKRARVLLQLRHFDDALAQVHAALTTVPTLPIAETVRADILRAQGKKAEARAARRDAKALARSHRFAHA